MDLSVIIVNYNVSHFLEQAIVSVQKAMSKVSGEIIVIDNNSVDDSCKMIRSEFPQVKIIENKENIGFSRANNQGINIAQGEFILILNPDTIVHQDCIHHCINYFKVNKNVGAIGAKMLDGSGKILPESKRGFPTAWVSFCKMTGLYKLFPKSKLFNSYYLGHLSYEEICEVEVLTGAFFFTRKSLIQKIGGFDESFFMYGEDIDLSHRVRQEGYTLLYLPEARIVHFKGESTKKSNINYWYAFYSAMYIFSKKHSKNIALLNVLKIAIFCKGILSFVKSLFKRTIQILIDGTFIVSGVYLIKKFWSHYFYNTPYHFQSTALWFNAFLYCFVWVFCFYIVGVYDKKSRIQDFVMATITGFIINLTIYALIPESLRSSRAILGITFLFVLIYGIVSRLLFSIFKTQLRNDFQKILVLGNNEEKELISNLIEPDQNSIELLSHSLDPQKEFDSSILNYYKPNEVIVCPSYYSNQDITNLIRLIPEQITFKILNPSGKGIIGSKDSKSQGQLLSLENTYHLNQEKYQRQKRFFDFIFSLFLLLFSWIFVFFQDNKKNFILNIFDSMFGVKSWVGIKNTKYHSQYLFKKCILHIAIVDKLNIDQWFVIERIENYYKNYSLWMDLDICLRDVTKLGDE